MKSKNTTANLLACHSRKCWQLPTIIMDALHLDEPVPEPCYCTCWLTGMSYWDLQRNRAIINVISYTCFSCLYDKSKCPPLKYAIDAHPVYIPWICLEQLKCGDLKQKKEEKKGKNNTATSSLQSFSLLVPFHFHPPLAVRMSVGLFALPDVSWREETACLSSVRTSDSHVCGLSQLPFLRSLKVSPSSLHGQASATVPWTEWRLEELLVFAAIKEQGWVCKYVSFKVP